MNLENLPANIDFTPISVNFEIEYGSLMAAIEGWEIVLQEGIIRYMSDTLSVDKYSYRVSRLAELMENIREFLIPMPAPNPPYKKH